MDSDPPHARINQFFSSKKKRKNISGGAAKTKRPRKDAKLSIAEPPELEHFATDFLSLYCGNVPSMQMGLKKCSNHTPESTTGSSIFSPGDTFWNEAIQVADGLFSPTHHPDAASNTKLAPQKVSPMPVNHFDFTFDDQQLQVTPVLEPPKGHINRQNTDQLLSDSPQLKFTPSSSASLKDFLDLSNWLPSEICSVYKKKMDLQTVSLAG